MSISVVVLAKNEASNIADCLRSVGWCDDVVVVDDCSTDDTREIAECHGARVIERPFTSFAEQRNWALEHAQLTNDWVLMLDADELATDAFRQGLLSLIADASADVAGVQVCRKTMFWGRWLRRSDSFPVWVTRVIHRRRAWFVDVGHGEQARCQEGRHLMKLGEPLIHFPLSKGLSDWMARHNRYSTREAVHERQLRAGRWRWRDLFADSFRRRQAMRALSRGTLLRPALRFLYQYFFRGGFLEGRAGFVFCSLMAIYETMIVFKRWELGHIETTSSARDTKDADFQLNGR